MHQCIGGANAALDALQRHDTAATVSALQGVDAPCRAAQSAQGGPTPRYGFDFPDPYVLVAGTEHYAFATNATGGNIQVIHRQPDGSWATAGDALGQFPPWAAPNHTWAPSVLPRLIGYVMYYTVREAATGRQCVSRATSLGPGGPYVDTSTGPLVCGAREALDPEAVVAADGTPVLLWKRERPAAIVAQPLTPDGLALAGTERELLRASQRWEDTNVEAPSMLVNGAGAWLFFSGGNWNGSKYATGVVHCAGALGPCDRSSAAPLLRVARPPRGAGWCVGVPGLAGDVRARVPRVREPERRLPGQSPAVHRDDRPPQRPPRDRGVATSRQQKRGLSNATGSHPRRSASMPCVVANVFTGGNESFALARCPSLACCARNQANGDVYA